MGIESLRYDWGPPGKNVRLPGICTYTSVFIPIPEVVPIPTTNDGSKYNSLSSLDILPLSVLRLISNLVGTWFIVVSKDKVGLKREGVLGNIAPTILDYLKIQKPKEMIESLLKW